MTEAYKKSNAVFLMYDINKRNTFVSLGDFFADIAMLCPNAYKLLIGIFAFKNLEGIKKIVTKLCKKGKEKVSR